jgi:hypothetical protein
MDPSSMMPPGLAGYLQAQQANQQQGMSTLQQIGAIQSIQANEEKQKRDQAYRAELTALGPDATDEQLAAVAGKYGGPDALLKAKETAIAKKASLEQAKAAADAKLEQNTKYAEMMHEFRMSRAQTDADRAAETARHNQVIEGLQTQNAGIMQELKRQGLQIQADKVQAGAANQLQKQTQQLGTALERANMPEADATIRGVEDALKKAPNLAEYLSGPKSLLPDAVVPEDIRAGRQAFQKLFNITLKNRSGAAVTTQELDRLKAEFGAGAFKTKDQLEGAVQQARSILGQHYRGIASGFGKDTLDAYNANLRELGGTPLLETQGTPNSASSGQIKRLKFDANGNPL